MPKGLWFPARWIRYLFALEETSMLVSPLTPHPVRPSSVIFFLPSIMHSGAQVTEVERCVGDEELVWGTKLRIRGLDLEKVVKRGGGYERNG